MTDTPQPIPDQIKLPGALTTAREAGCFLSFTSASTMADVVRKCGLPDEHQGSGIYIFLYDMADGSVIAIGTADLNGLLYVNHIQDKGASSLLKGARRTPAESKHEILSARRQTRYFTEDHLTGAMYIALSTDGNYTITAREHVGVWVEETGRWRKSGASFTFTPNKPKRDSYSATEVMHKRRTFLALQGDSAPSIAVPIEETKHDLDQNPNTVPPYVFFEITANAYRRETKQTYPFRTRPNSPQLIVTGLLEGDPA